MPRVNFRLTASEDVATSIINEVSALEGVQLAEEVADLMQTTADVDSSSAGLPDDTGPGSHAIAVETSNDTISLRVREVAEAIAGNNGAAIEFVERF